MNKEEDAEANLFARLLLVPDDLLRKEVYARGAIDLCSDKQVKLLADRFKVPVAVMVIRLNEVFEP